MTASRRLRALIVQHEQPTPPGRIGEWLAEQDVEVDVLRIDEEARTPSPRDYDLMVSLGSEFATYNDSIPFIPREIELIRAAADANVPILGVCFGGQLMARALGGKSFKADRSEIGWVSVRTNDPDLVPDGPWFNWHFDSFTLPPGAKLIAETDAGPQAYVIGRNLGLQFHPEVTPEIMDSWVGAYRHELDAEGVDPDALLEETKRRAPQARKTTERLLNNFLDGIARLNRETASGR
jgi:GMP synthase-like glutamine amidotransferase